MRLAVALVLVICTGCIINTGGRSTGSAGTRITVVNITANAYLDILVEGQVLARGIPPGEHCVVPIGSYRNVSVTVVGRNKNGEVLGATSDVFYGGEPRYYNSNYSGYYGGTEYSKSWIINTSDLRKRE